MKVEFLARFDKDLDSILDKRVLEAVAEVIETMEAAAKLGDVSNVKKLTGFKMAYRLRVGHYRIGFFLNGQTVEFARIAHRKEIYKLFP